MKVRISVNRMIMLGMMMILMSLVTVVSNPV